MFRKTWALVLTVALLISCLAPFSAFAADFEAFELKYAYHGSANSDFRFVCLGSNLPENPTTVLVGASVTGTLEHDGGSLPFNSTIKSVDDRGDGNFTLTIPECETVKRDDWKDEGAEVPKHTFKLTVHPAGTSAPVVVAPTPSTGNSSKQDSNAVSVGRVTFTDIAESPYKDEINLLNAISVLAGDPAGTFRPNDTISRAEMAAIIVRIYGMESSVSTSSGATEFTDVPDSHWGAGYISLAAGLGVINGDGDGTFRPDDKVTYNEAVKMLVCVLGYGMEASERGGWPTGYLVVANDLDITEDVITTSGDASRETVAKLVANALDIEYLEKTGFGETETYVSYPGRTLLSEKLKVEKIEDVVVTETYLASYYGEGSLKENQVRVGDTIYWISAEGIDAYLGYPVTIYAKEDKKVDKDYKFVIHYEINDENTDFLTYSADEIANAEGDEIDVFEDDKSNSKISYSILTSTPVFVNGIGDRGFDIKKLDPKADGKPSFNGKITIIDIEQDEVIDVLFVDIMQTMVVDRVVPTNGGFYVKGKDGSQFPDSKIDLKDKNVKLSITKDGKVAEYTDIDEYDVLAYYGVGKTYNIQISSDTVGGIVEKVIGTDKVVVDGETYEYSPIVTIDTPCEVGDDVTLYMDVYGKIAYVKTVATGAEDYTFLLDIGVVTDSMDGNEYFAKVYSKDNGVEVLPFSDEITFITAGVASDVYETDTITNSVWKEYGLMSGNEFKSQLIKYSTDSEDKIESIEVATQITEVNKKGEEVMIDPSDYEESDLKMFRKLNPTQTFYAWGSGSLASNSSGDSYPITLMWKGVDFLFVPNKGGDIIEEDIAISKAENFFASPYSPHSAAQFTWYDTDENGLPAFIVAELDIETSKEFSSSRDSSYMIITDVAAAKTAKGKAYEITGLGGKYRGNMGEIQITLDATMKNAVPDNGPLLAKSVAELQIGDVISFAQMPNGKVYRWNLMFTANDSYWTGKYGFAIANDGSNNLVNVTKYPGTRGNIVDIYAGYLTDYNAKDDSFVIRVPGVDGDGIEYELPDFKQFLCLDMQEGTLKEIDYIDIPKPESVSIDDTEAPLPNNVIEIDGEYYLCPRVVLHLEDRGSGNRSTPLQLMYIDDGTFED